MPVDLDRLDVGPGRAHADRTEERGHGVRHATKKAVKFGRAPDFAQLDPEAFGKGAPKFERDGAAARTERPDWMAFMVGARARKKRGSGRGRRDERGNPVRFDDRPEVTDAPAIAKSRGTEQQIGRETCRERVCRYV